MSMTSSAIPATHSVSGQQQSTPLPKPTRWGNFIHQIGLADRTDIIVPIAVLSIVLAMIVPIPSFLIDLLISANISVSVLILLVAMYIARPVEFSVFPTTLLLLTLFRLALNISSSRLILMDGNRGTAAAGHVIEAFGNFVVGGNFVIGLVIFLVLIAIQYVVINHGAVRISEVTARFTLDALPGKQMSIDADLNAGLIDETEARTRRKQLASEAEFYGSMDGASRFTQRDAVASILITAINIIAGILIGILQHGMDIPRAIRTYTVLTIGDGLVTVIPALMISISGGLIVTRAGSDAALSSDFRKQIFTSPQPIYLASAALVIMALLPGLPKIPFFALAGGLFLIGQKIRKTSLIASPAPGVKNDAARKPASPVEPIDSLLRVDPLSIELGLGLIRLAEGGQNSALLRRISSIRRQLAGDLGFLLPAVQIADNLSLKSREYKLLLKGNEIARFELQAGCDLALFPPDTESPLKVEGVRTKEPAFGLEALWIPHESIESARSAGFTIVEPISILTTHFAELMKRHAHELLGRQETKKILDRVAEEHPRVVEDLVPKLLPLAIVQKVFQNLLREKVSIRDAASILEALGEAAGISRNPLLLTEYVRQAIRRTVLRPLLHNSQEIHAWFLDPKLEQLLESSIEHGENSSHLNLSPGQMKDFLDRLQKVISPSDVSTVIMTGTQARPFVRLLTESIFPGVTIVSHAEVPSGIRLISSGVIG